MTSLLTWIQDSGSYGLPYRDNNVVGLSLFIFFVTTIPAAFVLISVKLFDLFLLHKPSYFKRFVELLLYPLSVLFLILMGIQFIMLLVMSTVGNWYIGGPLLMLFWIISFFILNREYKFPVLKQLGSPENTNETVNETVNEVELPEQADDTDGQEIILENAEPVAVTCCGMLKGQTRIFFENIGRGAKRRWWLVLIMLPVIILIVLFVSLITVCLSCCLLTTLV
jgi:hypothetical protein